LNWIKKNINGILGTIIFHLIIVIIAMFFEFKSQYKHIESYTYVEAEFLDEFLDEKLKADNNQTEEINLEQRMAEIRNLGSNRNQTSVNENIESMSLEEIRKKYEAEILKEKYGEQYEDMINKTHEDYLDKNKSQDNSFSDRFKNHEQANYSGPALVFIELDNKDRATYYAHVPVFTCQDGGVVVIDIVVSPTGKVIKADLKSVNGSNNTDCIVNESRQSALKTVFAPVTSGNNETGIITYHFIQQ
jgi:hypothetical protein